MRLSCRGAFRCSVLIALGAMFGAFAAEPTGLTFTPLFDDPNTGPASSSPVYFVYVDDALFFSASSSPDRYSDLWRYSFLDDRAVRVADLNQGPDAFYVERSHIDGGSFGPFVQGGFVYWKAAGIWRCDTNGEHLEQIAPQSDLIVGVSERYIAYTVLDSPAVYSLRLFDSANGETIHLELPDGFVRSYVDVAAAGENLVIWIDHWVYGYANGSLTLLHEFPGFYYIDSAVFTVGDRVLFSEGHELWGTDGTISGTALVRTFDGEIAQEDSAINGVGVAIVYEGMVDGAWHTWRTDGTGEGTIRLDFSFPIISSRSRAAIYGGGELVHRVLL